MMIISVSKVKLSTRVKVECRVNLKVQHDPQGRASLAGQERRVIDAASADPAARCTRSVCQPHLAAVDRAGDAQAQH
ncbi:unnamed protein product, partial [Iphiclides podalirius]